MSVSLSFLSGIVAAFTPCVIVLMPILLYRFFHEEDNKDWKKFLEFLVGFILSYIVFGYIFSALFTSSIQNGFKLGIGLIFIILGILSLLNKLNPINFPIIKNPFLLGTVFAMIISFNPCTLPYLSIIVSMNNSFVLFVNLISFGMGLIIPSIFFAFFGKKFLKFSKKTGNIFFNIRKLMDYILIISGIYLLYTIKSIKIYDIYMISIFLSIIFILIIRAYFLIYEKKDFLQPKNILLLLSLLLIILISINSCKYEIESSNVSIKAFGLPEQQSYSCTGDITQCEICQRCIYYFSIAVILGFIGILFTSNGKFGFKR